MSRASVPIFTRQDCNECSSTGKASKAFKLETMRYRSSESSSVIVGARCKVCQGFGYILVRKEVQKGEVAQVNSGIASSLRRIVKAHGLARICDSLKIPEDLLQDIMTREKRSCPRDLYNKLTELISMDKSGITKSERERLEVANEES